MASLVRELIKNKKIGLDQVRAIREKIRAEIEAAYQKALEAPAANPTQFDSLVFASGLKSTLPQWKKSADSKNHSANREPSRMENPF